MATYLTPDIYFERVTRDERHASLEIEKLNVPAFLGVAERGPIQEPTRITSWETFKHVFGDYTENAYLAYSVYGFFNNGGSDCFITRVAHIDDPDPEKNATRASTVLKDLYSRGTIQLDALNEGTWGNRLRVQVGVPKRVHRTALLQDIPVGATRARVEATRGFETGSLVRLTDGREEVFVRVNKVGKREIEWDDPVTIAVPSRRATAESVEFKLTVNGDDDFEIFDNLVMDPGHSRYFKTVINGNSQYIEVDDLDSSTDLPYNYPQPMTEVTLEGGRDGTEWVTAEDYVGFSKGPGNRSGLRAYGENDDIGLICMPDLHRSAIDSRGFRSEDDVIAVQKAAVDVATHLRYVHVILDPPPNLTPVLVQEYREQFDSRHAFLYYPWVKVLDPFGESSQELVTVPACGHVAGLIAKTDDAEGLHTPPANEPPLNDIIALERAIDKDTQDLIYPDAINCIRYFRGRGIRVWGSRTLSSDSQWRHITVTRVFAMICKSIENGTQWAPFEPNGPELWKHLVRLIGTFLTDLWRKGYLSGSIPEKAFYVKCDEETNPPETRDAGEVVCEIGLAIVRPLEFMVFRIGQRTSEIFHEEPA
ncbi:MAG: phage tail sheath family protein [Planctomycetota bacterium]|jgi:hypothetical protein